MKFKIKDKIQFIDLAEHIKPSKSYNVTILEAKVRETGFTDRQIEQITQIIAKTVPQIIAKTVPPLIEAALAPINKRLDRLEDFAVNQMAYNKKIDRIEKLVELMASTPTMKRELKELEEKDKK